jgi:hypothetical protein
MNLNILFFFLSLFRLASNVWILFLSRIPAGLLKHSQTIVEAYVTGKTSFTNRILTNEFYLNPIHFVCLFILDVTDMKTRAIHIGRVGVVVSLGKFSMN